MGEYQDNLTLEEALAVYDSIPPKRLNGIPCVGFHLKDGSIYEGDFPLMYGGKIDRDGINLVEHYKESPLVQKAISDLQTILDHRTAMQQRSSERATDPDEICYKVSSMYLHIQEASDGCWDYTLYDNQLREIDGGQLEILIHRFQKSGTTLSLIFSMVIRSLSRKFLWNNSNR